MSGMTVFQPSTAVRYAERIVLRSPSLRSPAVFISFSSNWNDSSSMESCSSCAGFGITSRRKPIAWPDSAAALLTWCGENACVCRAS